MVLKIFTRDNVGDYNEDDGDDDDAGDNGDRGDEREANWAASSSTMGLLQWAPLSLMPSCWWWWRWWGCRWQWWQAVFPNFFWQLQYARETLTINIWRELPLFTNYLGGELDICEGGFCQFPDYLFFLITFFLSNFWGLYEMTKSCCYQSCSKWSALFTVLGLFLPILDGLNSKDTSRPKSKNSYKFRERKSSTLRQTVESW